MEKDIIKVDFLGTLTIKEIYYFYEEPQVFSCINKFGQIFLGLLIDIDIRKWLMLPISLAQLSQLKSNNLSIREAFLNAEDEFVWRVVEECKISKATQIYIEDIEEEDLPDNDLYLDCEDNFMPSINNNEIVNESFEERRDILDLSLLPLSKHSRELDLTVMGEVLINVQQIIYSLAIPKDYNSNKIPIKIKNENKLVATGTYAASFGIRVKSYELSDFNGDTKLSNTFKEFCKILDYKNNKLELKNILKNYNPRVTLRYKKLMECLYREDLAFNFSFASPNKFYYKTEFDKSDILNNILFLDEQIENMIKLEVLEGTIVGINVTKRTFAFETLEKEMIIGSISTELNKFVYEVPKFVKVCLEKTIQLNDLTSEEKYKYKLLEVQEI